MRTSNLLWLLSFIVCLTAVSFCTSNCLADTAEVVANFDDGNSETEIDAYVGIPGNGWSTAWKLPAIATQDATATVLSSGDAGFDEIVPGSSGSYLSYTGAGNTVGAAGSSALTRKYNGSAFGIDLTSPHSVEFTVRIDEDVSNAWTTFHEYYDRYYIYDHPLAPTGSNSDCRWLISAYGGQNTAGDAAEGSVGQWSFYNGSKDGTLSGANNLSTGITLETGGVYDFTIDVDPATQSYNATVTNGVDTFSATDLGWRTAGTDSGGYLGFNMRNSTSDDVRAMSLDNVKVSQEGWVAPGGMNQISSHFDGGNTDTVVDAYPGMAGNGWGSPWQRLAPAEDPTVSGETLVVSSGDAGYQELAPGEGAYLSHTLEISAGNALRVQSSANRNYATARPGIDFTKEHTINFKIRIDEDVDGAGTTFTGFDDRYYLFDTPTANHTGPSATTSWMISAFGDSSEAYGGGIVGEWTLYDGANNGSLYDGDFVDTNMALTAGGVYEFTITVDPDAQTYDATVSDGTSLFSATDLGWRTAAKQVGGNLAFAAWGIDGGDTRAFSLDSLVITQGEVGPVIPGDADRNGVVDDADAALLAANWQTQGGATWGMGDFNYDGNVDDIDATILATNWQTAASASVPEPSTLALLSLLGLSVLALRRRNG